MHGALILFWPKPPNKPSSPQPVSIVFLPAPEETSVRPSAIPKQAPTRPSRAPAIIAKKSSPVLEDRPISSQQNASQREPRKEPPAPRESATARFSIVERPLPTVKELLPPLTWSSSEKKSATGDKPVQLDTREPKYITYFGSIKRSIELVWQYPEQALRYGLQGKLLMEFIVLGNGELEGIRLIRSSGSSLLDEEALRAVKAAAPFHPIPSWIGESRLVISATFEYHDNRLNYRFLP